MHHRDLVAKRHRVDRHRGACANSRSEIRTAADDGQTQNENRAPTCMVRVETDVKRPKLLLLTLLFRPP